MACETAAQRVRLLAALMAAAMALKMVEKKDLHLADSWAAPMVVW